MDHRRGGFEPVSASQIVYVKSLGSGFWLATMINHRWLCAHEVETKGHEAVFNRRIGLLNWLSPVTPFCGVEWVCTEMETHLTRFALHGSTAWLVAYRSFPDRHGARGVEILFIKIKNNILIWVSTFKRTSGGRGKHLNWLWKKPAFDPGSTSSMRYHKSQVCIKFC